MDKIIFMVRKSKLMLLNYQRSFQDYLNKIRAKEDEHVNEQIIKTFETALISISSYLKVLVLIESQIQSPRIVSEYIENLQLIMNKYSYIVTKIESKVDALTKKVNHRK